MIAYCYFCLVVTFGRIVVLCVVRLLPSLEIVASLFLDLLMRIGLEFAMQGLPPMVELRRLRRCLMQFVIEMLNLLQSLMMIVAPWIWMHVPMIRTETRTEAMTSMIFYYHRLLALMILPPAVKQALL